MTVVLQTKTFPPTEGEEILKVFANPILQITGLPTITIITEHFNRCIVTLLILKATA